MTEERPLPKPYFNPDDIRTFGRVQGRTLSAYKKELLHELLPEISIDMDAENINPADLFIEDTSKFWLEIGFGAGEHLATQAESHYDTGIIGCEPYLNGVASLLRYIDQQVLWNVRILYGDARLLVEKLQPESLDRVFILFPDPWPKVKHHKKRLVNEETLALLSKVMKPNAELLIVTDHEDYKEWLSELLADNGYFSEQHQGMGSSTPPVDWIETRYQKKAREEGRDATFYVCTQKSG